MSLRTKLRSRWRKVVTGDENKRIREFLIESQEKDEYIKLFDKISFTLGVLNIGACQYFLLNLPGWFWIWWSIVTPLLLFARFHHFKYLNYEYFLLDFCYFVTGSVFASLYIFSDSIWFSNICYIYALGPLLFAILLWRNSLVFHDYDKITSVYIHMLPSMICHIRRFHGHYTCSWQLLSILGVQLLPAVNVNSCVLIKPTKSFQTTIHLSEYVYAMIGYILWQSLYFYKTEILDKSKLDLHPSKQTSLRWMSRDLKNPFVHYALKIVRKLGVFTVNESPDPETTKTKLMFVICQFLYTLCTFVPTYFLYQSKFLSLLFIGFIFTVAVFNGASFYIEVFSKRYQYQFQKRQSQSQQPQQQTPSQKQSIIPSTQSTHEAIASNDQSKSAVVPLNTVTTDSIKSGNVDESTRNVNSLNGIHNNSTVEAANESTADTNSPNIFAGNLYSDSDNDNLHGVEEEVGNDVLDNSINRYLVTSSYSEDIDDNYANDDEGSHESIEDEKEEEENSIEIDE